MNHFNNSTVSDITNGCNHECNQGRDCKCNCNPASQEAAWYYISTILAGIGVFSFVMAIVIWSLK
jgi:hypothetical protein